MTVLLTWLIHGKIGWTIIQASQKYVLKCEREQGAGAREYNVTIKYLPNYGTVSASVTASASGRGEL